MLALYYKRIIRYSYLESNGGRILIIKDKKHNIILDKIRTEKRKLLREKYFLYNEDNTPEQEIAKYQYLRDDGAITQEEFVKASEDLLKKHGVIKQQE